MTKLDRIYAEGTRLAHTFIYEDEEPTPCSVAGCDFNALGDGHQGCGQHIRIICVACGGWADDGGYNGRISNSPGLKSPCPRPA